MTPDLLFELARLYTHEAAVAANDDEAVFLSDTAAELFALAREADAVDEAA